jgi:hypothetical protein
MLEKYEISFGIFYFEWYGVDEDTIATAVQAHSLNRSVVI